MRTSVACLALFCAALLLVSGEQGGSKGLRAPADGTRRMLDLGGGPSRRCPAAALRASHRPPCPHLPPSAEVHASRDLLAKGGNGKGRGNGGQGGQGQGGQGGGRGKPVRVCPFPCATCNGNSTK